ncbi:MAG: hypothetical protein RLZZ59_311 [Pseudomonadota bacterium]|jgi:glycosyltransferase involved in cell wall biosynthesis
MGFSQLVDVTYLILLHNNSQTLPALAESIKSMDNNFKSEYLIIDDASSDDTKTVAQQLFSKLPRVTILANSIYSGPAFSINDVIHLIQGRYVHFVIGGDILSPNSTSELIKACEVMGTSLAFGLKGKLDDYGIKNPSEYETSDISIIDRPIANILEGKIPGINDVGNSGTLVEYDLLDKISGIDSMVFLHNTSLALRCAKHSKFASVKRTLYYTSQNHISEYNKKFQTTDYLSAVARFMEGNPEIAECYKPEIYKSLWSKIWSLDKYKVRTLPRYLLSRYINRNLDCSTLIDTYRSYIAELEV